MSDEQDTTDFNADKVEAIQQKAKEQFSLEDMLAGVRPTTAKQLVFPDGESVKAWSDSKVKLEKLSQELDALQANPMREDEAAAKLDEFEEQSDVVDQLQNEALSKALAVHMVAIPDVAVSRARRSARKGATSKDEGLDPDVFNKLFAMNLMSLCIVKIVKADGAEATFDHDKVGQLLNGILPATQFQALDETMSTLLFNDTVGQLATHTPDF